MLPPLTHESWLTRISERLRRFMSMSDSNGSERGGKPMRRRPYIVYYQDSDGQYHCEIIDALSREEANTRIAVREGARCHAVFGPRLPKGMNALQQTLLRLARERQCR